MSLILRRYTRTSGYAPSWFYVVATLGFIALTIWAVIRGDWLVTALAAAMITATIAVAIITRHLKAALDASNENPDELTH
jgi:uncharacterized ion transporter superfamily protein YfcC